MVAVVVHRIDDLENTHQPERKRIKVTHRPDDLEIRFKVGIFVITVAHRVDDLEKISLLNTL